MSTTYASNGTAAEADSILTHFFYVMGYDWSENKMTVTGLEPVFFRLWHPPWWAKYHVIHDPIRIERVNPWYVKYETDSFFFFLSFLPSTPSIWSLVGGSRVFIFFGVSAFDFEVEGVSISIDVYDFGDTGVFPLLSDFGESFPIWVKSKSRLFDVLYNSHAWSDQRAIRLVCLSSEMGCIMWYQKTVSFFGSFFFLLFLILFVLFVFFILHPWPRLRLRSFLLFLLFILLFLFLLTGSAHIRYIKFILSQNRQTKPGKKGVIDDKIQYLNLNESFSFSSLQARRVQSLAWPHPSKK